MTGYHRTRAPASSTPASPPQHGHGARDPSLWSSGAGDAPQGRERPESDPIGCPRCHAAVAPGSIAIPGDEGFGDFVLRPCPECG